MDLLLCLQFNYIEQFSCFYLNITWFVLLLFIVELEISNGDTSGSSIVQDCFNYPRFLTLHKEFSIVLSRSIKSMREWDAQEGGRTVGERKERAILIEGAIKGLVKKITLGKFPGIQKDESS